jgi:hypothetical protein
MTGSRGRLAWLVTGLVTTVVAIALAASGIWYLAAFPEHLHPQDETISYAGHPDLVTVQLSDGNIAIANGPPGRVFVTRHLLWSGSMPEIDQQWNGHALKVVQDCPSGFDETCTVSYQITVPPGVALDLQTYSGNITAIGSRSPQTQASTYAGDVQLGFAAPPDSVYASSDAGNVMISVPSGDSYAVHQQAPNGNWDVGVVADPTAARSITAISASGNVAVGYN